MQRLEVSGAVRLIYKSLGVKGLILRVIFEELFPGVPQNSVGKAERPGLFQVIKYGISNSAYEYFDFGRAGQASTSH